MYIPVSEAPSAMDSAMKAGLPELSFWAYTGERPLLLLRCWHARRLGPVGWCALHGLQCALAAHPAPRSDAPTSCAQAT